MFSAIRCGLVDFGRVHAAGAVRPARATSDSAWGMWHIGEVLGAPGTWMRSGAVFVKAELRFGLALQVSGAGLAHYSLGL